jgi:hypothetical protein
MNRTVLLLIIAAALMIGFVLYRSHSATKLNLTRDAEREIEKAKGR